MIKPRFFWPITLEAGVNDVLRLTISSEGASPFLTASLAGTYNSPEALCYAIKQALTTVLAAAHGTWTGNCTFLASGYISIGVGLGTGGKTVKLTWTADPKYAALGDILGFDTATDTQLNGGVLGYGNTGTKQAKNVWLPDLVASDPGETLAFSRSIVESTGGVVGVDTATLRRRRMSFEMVPGNKVFTLQEDVANEAVQHLWEDGAAGFLIWDDAATTGLSATPAGTDVGNGLWYALDEQTAQKFEPTKRFLKLEIYDFELGMVGTE